MADQVTTPRVTVAEALEASAQLLLNGGLYTKLDLFLAKAVTTSNAILPDRLMRPCEVCETTTTWKKVPDRAYFEQYKCALCENATVEYWLRVEWDEKQTVAGGSVGYGHFAFRKIGQWPPPSITPPPPVAKALTRAQLDLYKKGLTCMAQGYGIGALGYFRRVVEDSIVALLDVVKAGAEGEGDEKTVAAVERAKGAKNTDEKLKLVADLVPRSLRPGGVNPLALLHDHYSKGLHALSDDE